MGAVQASDPPRLHDKERCSVLSDSKIAELKRKIEKARMTSRSPNLKGKVSGGITERARKVSRRDLLPSQ